MCAAVALLERDAADQFADDPAELAVVDDRLVGHSTQPAPFVLAHGARHVLAAADFLERRFALRTPVCLPVVAIADSVPLKAVREAASLGARFADVARLAALLAENFTACWTEHVISADCHSCLDQLRVLRLLEIDDTLAVRERALLQAALTLRNLQIRLDPLKLQVELVSQDGLDFDAIGLLAALGVGALDQLERVSAHLSHEVVRETLRLEGMAAGELRECARGTLAVAYVAELIEKGLFFGDGVVCNVSDGLQSAVVLHDDF